MRITESDVIGMYERCKRSARSAGVTYVAAWTLEPGSTTYGRAWRLFEIGENGGLADFLGSNGYLGMTRREAYDALHAMARAFELVVKDAAS